MTTGILKVCCIRGRNLWNCDKYSKQDPYVTFQLGNLSVSTSVKSRGGVDPCWFETVDLLVHQKLAKTKNDAEAICGGSLVVTAWDEDWNDADLIGSGSLDISSILASQGTISFNGEVQLTRTKEKTGGQAQDAGTIRLHVCFVALNEEDFALYENKLAKQQIKEGAKAVIKLGSAMSKIAGS